MSEDADRRNPAGGGGAPRAQRGTASEPVQISRRGFLLTAGAVSATGLFAACSGPRAAGTAAIGPHSPEVAQFAVAQARPGAATRRFSLTPSAQRVELGGGLGVDTWTYGGGTVPGPLLRGTSGETMRIDVANRLPVQNPDGEPSDTTVHWHGLAIRNDMDGAPDGVTQEPIRAGADMTYEFTLPQSGTYWYHSHVGTQRDRGLIGPLVIDDPAEPGRYDAEFVVVLDDWLDGISGLTPAKQLADLRRTGMVGMDNMGDMAGGPPLPSAIGADGGDVDYPFYLINGRIPADPTVFTARPGARARIRLINAAGDTAFRVALGGHRMRVTHADAFPVVPTDVDAVLLGSGERYDVVVELADGAFPLVAAAERKSGGARAVVRTSRAAAAPGPKVVPPELTRKLLAYSDLRADAAVALGSRTPDRTHQIVLTADMARYVWMLNGRTFDQREPLPISRGERVRLQFVNQTMMYHPMHLHGHSFALRDPAPVGGADGARKDTVNVLPMQTVTVDFDADNPGQWMTHCHLAYHEAAGMMSVLSYTA